MKKSFCFGIIFLGMVLISTAVMKDWHILIYISGGISIVGILLAGLFLGAFVDGDRSRLNFQVENKQDRQKREQAAYKIFLFVLPNFITVILYFII